MASPTAPTPVSLSVDLKRLIDYTPDIEQFKDAIIAELKQAFLDAYESAANGVAINTAVRDAATEYAQERAGELIADLTDATRDGVKELVSQVIDNGMSLDQLARALRDHTSFGADRARVIARTETAIALGKAQRQAADDMGQDEKKWQPGECEYCQQNAGDGWIGIDETFSSGDDTIPAHPQCTCDVIYRTHAVHEAALPPVVKEARCPDCHRLLARGVNVGAALWCQRCRAEKVVRASQ